MRDPRHPADSFRLDSWLVEPSLNTLTQGGQAVRIEPRTMNVLAYLAARAGKVVSQAELEKAVWTDVVVTPQSVYQSIAQLRRVLGDDARDPKYIATVSRRGYRLIATVTPIDAAASVTATSVEQAAARHASVEQASAGQTSVGPASVGQASVGQASAAQPSAGQASTAQADGVQTGSSVPTAADLPARRRGAWYRPRALAAAGALVALIAIAAAILLYRNWREPASVSIAVLPFHDLSTARNNAPFCDGLTDELSSALAQLSEVRVIARDSTYQFRDSKRDAREIGSRLGVTHLLEGSVRRDANHLRVTAALIDASSGVQVWSRSIDKATSEILRVQQEIANDVVAALQLELSPQSAQRLREKRAIDPNAYELYLLGRYQQLQRDPAALERAINYHKEALARDPAFALAYAGLADAQMALYFYRSLPLEETAPQVEANVQHALDLDSGLAEAYAARGVLRTEQWRLPEAIADLEKAIVLKPNNGEALIRLGAAYEYLGQPRDALKQYDQAIALDPLHFILHIRRCLTLQNIGQFAAATQSCARARDLQPDNPNGYWTTGLIALAQGDLAGASDGYERALAKAPWRVDLQLQLAWILLDAGKPDDARRYFDAAESHQNGDEAIRVALERGRFFIATGTPADLAQYLNHVDSSSLTNATTLLDAALLEIVANRPQRAHELAQRARALLASGESAVFENVWEARWGRNPRLTLALDAFANSDAEEAERQLTALERWLQSLDAHGQVWHGVKYLHASVQALRGHKADALAALNDAVETGWRRAWWTEADPALQSLRREKAFAVALEHMRARTAPLHAAVSGQ